MTRSHEAGASPRCTGLARVSDLDLDRFGEHWGRAPRHVPAGRLPAPFEDLLSTEDVDDLLSRRGLRTPFLRVARDGVTVDAGEFTRGGGVGAAIADQLDDSALLRLFADGHTLVLQALHRTHPPVVDFAQDLAADLGHPVQVNAYVTPPGSRGFAAHFDVHDVFVLQTTGEKQWRLYPPVRTHPLREDTWQQHRDEVAAAAERPPHLDVTLRPGDVLYVPRGWLHSATALGGMSTHLTVGVHVWNRAHLAEVVSDLARRAVLAGEEGRSPLRPGVDVGDPDDWGEDLTEVRAALLHAVSAVDSGDVAAALSRRHRDAQRPAPLPPVATTEAAGQLDGAALAVRRHVAATLETAPSGRVLASRAGRLPLAPSEVGAVGTWLDAGAQRVDQLGVELARRLLLAGVAELVEGSRS